MNLSIALIPIFCSFALFGMLTIIAVAASNGKKARAKLHAEVQTRLIDKFGSAPEFIAFLSTPAGREFVGGYETQPRLMARERILKGVRTATVLSFLGLAFCLIALFDSNRDFLYPGFILLGLGGGYVLSSILTMRLSKAWGLLEPPKHDDVIPQAFNR